MTNGCGCTIEKPRNTILSRLEMAAEGLTGQSADELRKQTLTALRRKTEARTKKKLSFVSRFPLVGRGNVMREKVIDHSSVEAQLRRALK